MTTGQLSCYRTGQIMNSRHLRFVSIDIAAGMPEHFAMIFAFHTLRRLSSDRRPSIAPCVACGFAQPELTMDQT